jgi:hypothetical protein
MTWTTPEQASSVTGVGLAQADLDKAYPIIEIFAGVTTDAQPTLKPRDLRLLRYAEAYQAAWMQDQVNVTGRLDIADSSQDGTSWSSQGDDTLILAPLAKRSINRLSWRKSRTLRPLTPEQALTLRGRIIPGTIAGTEEWYDDQQDWQPMDTQ